MEPLRYSLLTGLVCVVAGAQTIFTIAGIPYGHRDSVDGKPALNAPLNNVHGLLIDKATGRLLFGDFSLVLRLEPDQSLLAVAGRGLAQDGETADHTLASFLKTTGLAEMAQDAAGALYVSDIFAGRVYRIGPDGTVTTFAGRGNLSPGFGSDGGPATAALLGSPRGLAFDSKGNLSIGEVFCGCIRRVSPDGIISTVYTIPRPSAQPSLMHEIEGLTIDAQDNLYFTEWMGDVVVRVAPDGTATTIAGTGVAGFSGDGGPANAAQLNGPSGVTLDAYGNLYITDSMNHRVRKVAPDGTISTIAGTGQRGFSGDGGPAAAAQLDLPAEMVFDGAGNLYITEFGNRRVRRVAPDGTISTIAGNGETDPFSRPQGSTGDGGPAIHATLSPTATVFDASGNLYVSDANRIRKIAPDGSIGTFAGTGVGGYSGDGGPALQAKLSNSGPLAIDAHGNLYVVTGDSRIRKITPDGIISLVAGIGPGTGVDRSQGDGGLAVNATLNEVGGIAFDTQGNIYIADTSNARLRKIDTNGFITTIAGPGQLGVDYYNAVAVDPQGNIFLAWSHAAVNASVGTVNRVNPDGSLTRVAGNGQTCPGGPVGLPFPFDGAPALQTVLCQVTGMMIDRNGIMYLVYGSLLLRITNDGIIHTVAGNPMAVAIGDGGPALQANISGQSGPGTPTFDATGNMYFAERGIGRVREVTTTPYMLKLSPDHIDSVGPMATTWTIATSANFAEPFPYAVRVRTADGGAWLSTNRVTGLIGESITVTVDPVGLAPGSYQGTISLVVGGGVASAIAQQLDLPVSLSVPQSSSGRILLGVPQDGHQ